MERDRACVIFCLSTLSAVFGGWTASCLRGADPPAGGTPASADSIVARVAAPAVALHGAPVPITVELVRGAAPALEPLEFRLEASGPGHFASTATVGTVISGGGTSSVLLESQAGIARIDLTSSSAGSVTLAVEEPSTGRALLQETVEDFEDTSGGFSHAGFKDTWEWGVPVVGPPASHSGRRLWATRLDGPPEAFEDSYLQTPACVLPASPAATIGFWHWYAMASGTVEISANGGAYVPLPGVPVYSGRREEFTQVNVDLAPFAGKTIRVRFHLLDDAWSARPGWYIDDVRLSGKPEEVLFLDPALDHDGDGIPSGEEISRGTSPSIADTDGDGLQDPVETGTGVLAGPADTGTDPLEADTDGGGERDGPEVAAGRDPHDALDDLHAVPYEDTVIDADGYRWSLQARLDLAVEGEGFPSAPGLADREGEATWYGPVRMGRLDVTRSIFSPREPPAFIRAVEILHNPGTTAVETSVGISGTFPAGNHTQVAATFSGDAILGADDDWVVTRPELEESDNYLAEVLVLSGPHALVRASSARLPSGSGSYSLRYDVTVPAGGMVALAHFAARDANEQAAIQMARDLRDLQGRAADALRGADVLNFAPDTDRDGIPDRFEIRHGLDPEDPSDAAADLDGDGLDNLGEFLAGSDPEKPDTDGDSIGDGDEVHLKGTDPARADTDGDGRTDPQDPYPWSLIVARLDLPPAALRGRPASIGVTLTAKGLVPVRPVPLALRSSGSAAFAAAAAEGILVSGGGTAAVVLEAPQGAARIDLTATQLERLEILVEDPSGYGIAFAGERLADFEASGGGVTYQTQTDPWYVHHWRWGAPLGIPWIARSGSKAWCARVADYPRSTWYDFIDTPAYDIPVYPGMKLEFWYWLHSCEGMVSMSVDGGDFVELGPLPENAGGYHRFELDLTPHAGHSLKLRLQASDANPMEPTGGFYLDDLRLHGSRSLLNVVEAPGDPDGDGLSSEAEVERGSDPLSSDTDLDGLLDPVETGTGTFIDGDDTGTEATSPHSDGGPFPDGSEVLVGLDPCIEGDDFAPVALPKSLITGSGFNWMLLRTGVAEADSAGAVSGAFLEIDGLSLPETAGAFLSGDGQSVLIGPQPMGRLEVLRHVFVPRGEGGFCRRLELLRNLTSASVEAEIQLDGLFDWGDWTEVFASSSGDAAFDDSDDWLIAHGAGTNAYKAAIVVLSGAGARMRHQDVQLKKSVSSWRYRVTVPPHETVGVLCFMAQAAGPDAALAKARELEALEGRALEGIPPSLGRRILNFPYDTDGDGIPDFVETAAGLDPLDPADGALDLDGDELTNSEEYLHGSSFRNADTDGDGIPDGVEVRGTQTDPTLADTDGDGREDPDDPYPSGIIAARLTVPAAAMAGVPVPVSVRLTDRGEAVTLPVRFRLEVSGSAVFGEEALRGRIIAGGGSHQVLLESEGGAAEIAFQAAGAGSLAFSLADENSVGMSFEKEVLEDFEVSDGTFTHNRFPGSEAFADTWEWGAPSAGPAKAHSGRRVWGTDLDSDARNCEGYLETPFHDLATTGALQVEFRHWATVAGPVLVSLDGTSFAPVPRATEIEAGPSGYKLFRGDLSTFAGKSVRFRLSQTGSSGSLYIRGWFIDDFRVTGSANSMRVIDPGTDGDGDGIETGIELARGTSPLLADTDGDWLGDQVETGTGVYTGPDSTGTDPLVADSDAGSMFDGLEVSLGLDPTSPADDFHRGPFPVTLRDGAGYDWPFQPGGSVKLWKVFDPALGLGLGALGFPPQEKAFRDATGQVLLLGPSKMGSLKVCRHVFIPAEGAGFARSIEILHNRGSAPVTVDLNVHGHGFDNAKPVIATSSGDLTVEAEDDWAVMEETWEGESPAVAFVFAGPRASVRPMAASIRLGDYSWTYGVEVPAGGAVAIQHFTALCRDGGAALELARALARREGKALDELPPGLSRKIVNFAQDSDGDGIPDEAEVALGLNPLDPTDAALDGDIDGLTNLREFLAGTDPWNADTDGDGLDDREEVEVSGTNPLLADSDGDGVIDPADPFPLSMVLAHLQMPRWTSAGTPTAVRVHLTMDGAPASVPLRFTLRALGAATFSATAARGTVVEGGGTDAVLLESTARGEAEVSFTAALEEYLKFRVEDSASAGIVYRHEILEDFEASGGGLEPGGVRVEWKWGAPLPAAGFAISGASVWATDFPTGGGAAPSYLDTPSYGLPPVPPISFEIWRWRSGDSCLKIVLLAEGGLPATIFQESGFPGTAGRYEKVVVDLSAHAGRSVRFRFSATGPQMKGDGVVIDDLRITGCPEGLQVLDPGGDFDGDGLSTSVEGTGGTDPLDADTDGDRLLDGAETATGVFAGPEDTGTDPLDADTDGGGMSDGEEVGLALDPLSPADDYFRHTSVPALTDGDGVVWSFASNGEIRGGMMSLQGDDSIFAPQDSVRVDPQGRGILFGPDRLGPVDATRHVFVPSAGPGFVRYLDVLRNPFEAEVTIRIYLPSWVSFFHSALLLETSSGDLQFSEADRWLLFGESLDPAGAAAGVAVQGLHPRLTASSIWQGSGWYYSIYDVRIPPLGTVSFLRFVARASGHEAAAARAKSLSLLDGKAAEGLGGSYGSALLNFSPDVDGDGLPDFAEEAFGLDARNPTDAAGDLDGDGLSNLDEFLAGSDPRSADTDADGLTDATEVRDLGTSPTRADTDGDGLPDGSDPYPQALVLARLELPPAAAVGVPAAVRLRLAAAGQPVLEPVRLILRIAGQGIFTGNVSSGRLLEGSGTGEALFESEGGEVAFEVVAGAEGQLTFALEDPLSWGMALQAEILEDFESDDGGFTHGGQGDDWEWGVPVVGPPAAPSGRRLWATNLDGNYLDNALCHLESPAHALPDVIGLTLEFRYWLAAASLDEARVLISEDGGEFVPISGRGILEPTLGAFETFRADLSEHAGHQVKIRVELRSDGSSTMEGLYVDCFRIFGPPLAADAMGEAFLLACKLLVIPSQDDEDRDGLANGEESVLGTDPFLPDTDGGGLDDGEEARRRLDPLDPSDDRAQSIFIRGDADGSGRLNITDAIYILNFLFLGGPRPPIADAADVDDSGMLNITDPIALLQYLFLGGKSPRAPYPEPGVDPTPDGL